MLHLTQWKRTNHDGRDGGSEMSARGLRFSSYVNINIVTETCYLCGCVFGLEKQFKENRVSDKESFYCPNGHSQSYVGETSADKAERLQRELEAEKKKKEWAENDARKAKAETKKLKTRVKNGCCPCCKRSFTNLARHIKTKHPEFAKDQP